MKKLYFSLHFLFVFSCMKGLSLASEPSSSCVSPCSSSNVTPSTPLQRFTRSIFGSTASWQQDLADKVSKIDKDFNCTQHEDGSMGIDGKFQVGALTWAVYSDGTCEERDVLQARIVESMDDWSSSIIVRRGLDGNFNIKVSMSEVAQKRSNLKPGCLSEVSDIGRVLGHLIKTLNPRSAKYGQ